MAVARLLIGAIVGLLLGVVITFVGGVAITIAGKPATADPSGLYGLLDVLAWTPLVGLVAGGVIGWRRGQGRPAGER